MDSNLIHFTNEEVLLLKNIIQSINAVPSLEPELFIHQIKLSLVHFPSRLKNVLESFIEKGNQKGYLCFSGFPLNESLLPPTPPSNNYHVGEKTYLAILQAFINEICGEMIAYEAEGHGKIFQDMVPNLSLSNTQTSLGSKVELELHTEQAFSPLKPDILSLACLKGNPTAKTYILHVHHVLDNLPKEEVALLFQPLWKIGVDMSFKMNGTEFIEGDIRGPIPILYGSLEDPFFVFDQDLMFGINEQSTILKQKIIDIYYQKREEHILQPGEILLIDNNRVVHGRSPFQPNFDEHDRFIIRSFVVKDYERTLYARPGGCRMIESKYS